MIQHQPLITSRRVQRGGWDLESGRRRARQHLFRYLTAAGAVHRVLQPLRVARSAYLGRGGRAGGRGGPWGLGVAPVGDFPVGRRAGTWAAAPAASGAGVPSAGFWPLPDDSVWDTEVLRAMTALLSGWLGE